MRKNLYIIALLAISTIFPINAQVTGLSDVRLFIDQGHSGRENMGIHGYSEAENVLRVGLALEDFLLTYTDMQAENIMLARRNDNVVVSLANRTDRANAFNADFFYSIHSDAAGGPGPNTTLFLYGGRRLAAGQAPIEELPEGGKAFGDLLNADLTSVMRVNTGGVFTPVGSRGNVNDLIFYGAPTNRLIPWLFVLRESNMAAHLSEAGFHTNPEQNMQKMNEEWKRLEAYAAFQSMVRFLTEQFGTDGAQEPPQIGITTGFIFDGEVDRPINAATITLTEGSTVKTYTTDCFDSLFNRFYNVTRDRELLRNGFFWVEGFTPGATVQAKIEAQGFETVNTTVTIPTSVGARTLDGLGVLDVPMLNLMPAIVQNVELRRDMSNNVIQRHPVDIIFSRRMDRASVEQAFSIAPAQNVVLSWVNDFTLRVDISELNFETDYTITIDGSIARNTVTNDFLDGTADGTPGGNYVFSFRTSDLDIDPPVIVSFDPQGDQEESARPIVRIEFDEPLNEATTIWKISVMDEFGNAVDGVQSYYATLANFKSVLHFIFEEDLEPETAYVVTLAAGIEDIHGNAIEDDFVFTFTARPRETDLVTVLDNFNTLSGVWWQPGNSGSTVGIETSTTEVAGNGNVVPRTDHTGSVRLTYEWRPNQASYAIRWHNSTTTPRFNNSPNEHIQYYLFGDGSGTLVSYTARVGTAGNFFAHQAIALDWVGWKRVSWDLTNDPFWRPILGGAESFPANLNTSCFWITPAPADERLYAPSTMYFSRLRSVHLGDFIEERDSYSVTFSVVGANGAITAADATSTGHIIRAINSGYQVFEKRNVVFTATPNPGFQVKEWTLNGAVIAGNTTDIYTLQNLTANAVVTVEFEVSPTTGLENLLSSVQIFPNPFTDALNIAGAENSLLKVVDVLGTIVYTRQLTGANENVHLGNLPAGIYFFRLEKDGQTKTMKVVKQ